MRREIARATKAKARKQNSEGCRSHKSKGNRKGKRSLQETEMIEKICIITLIEGKMLTNDWQGIKKEEADVC